MIDTSPIAMLGVSGASGSGKSSLAETVAKEIGPDLVCIIPQDAYYHDYGHLPRQERDTVNFDHPDAFDHELLLSHLQKLKNRTAIEIPVYNYQEHRRESFTRILEPRAVVLIEGILLFTDERLRHMMEMLIYMDTPLDICFIRRLQRDVVERKRSIESVMRQYIETVRPMYFQFIEPSKRFADLIVPKGGQNRIAIECIKAKIRELLN